MSKEKNKRTRVDAIQGMVSKGINADLEAEQKPWLQQQGNSAKGPILLGLHRDPLGEKGWFPKKWVGEHMPCVHESISLT